MTELHKERPIERNIEAKRKIDRQTDKRDIVRATQRKAHLEKDTIQKGHRQSYTKRARRE